jgi:DNA polymerase IV
MPLALNHNPPTIMHVDLNSYFATIEQQANPLLRGKPMVVAAYNSPKGCVVAPSIEAKQYGIKTGMAVWEARLLYPKVLCPHIRSGKVPRSPFDVPAHLSRLLPRCHAKVD